MSIPLCRHPSEGWDLTAFAASVEVTEIPLDRCGLPRSPQPRPGDVAACSNFAGMTGGGESG
jgi:hypothetical protein